MPRIRVESISLSVDGFAAGPNQSLEHPLGEGGMAVHGWALPTRTFQTKVLGAEDGETGIDDDFAARGFRDVGAWILGRNMFGPLRGPWLDDAWKGWWGENPPYHVPAFVLTHYARDSIEMQGGTAFHFVTGGIVEALERARVAAAGRDVRIGGGVATIRQYLQARLVDEMHVAVSPVVLGAGETLFEELHLPSLGYRVVEHTFGARAMHVVFRRGA